MLYTYDVKYGPAFTIRDIQKNKRCDSLTEPGYTRAKEAKIQEVKIAGTGIRTGTISSQLEHQKNGMLPNGNRLRQLAERISRHLRR